MFQVRDLVEVNHTSENNVVTDLLKALGYGAREPVAR
jgi:hypothetical protein